MAYKQNPGRGPMMKTGRNIPKSMCSPLMQATDAISGKKIPANATFGKQKITFEDGYRISTTGYKTPGTPGSQGGPNPSKPDMPNKDWIKFKKNETPEAKAERLGRKGISGSVVSKTLIPKMAGIKPVESTSKLSGEVVQKTFTPKTPEQIQKNEDYIKKRNKTNKRNMRKMKQKKFWGNIRSAITPSGGGGFKPSCF